MQCIYCLEDHPPESLTDEHIIALSVGGNNNLRLRNASCAKCNNGAAARLDRFLADEFPPTQMARTELGLKGHSGKHPEMQLEAKDPALGWIDVTLRRENAGSEVRVSSGIRRDGNTLIAIAANERELFEMLRRTTKREVPAKNIQATGTVHIGEFRLKNGSDWAFAHRAAAKILYGYILLELGDRVLRVPSVASLRNYIRDGQDQDTLRPSEPAGKICDVAAHRHVIAFDSGNALTAVCLFGIFWFRFSLDLSPLAPHGRMVCIDPLHSSLIDPITKVEGNWHPRTSIHWGWSR